MTVLLIITIHYGLWYVICFCLCGDTHRLSYFVFGRYDVVADDGHLVWRVGGLISCRFVVLVNARKQNKLTFFVLKNKTTKHQNTKTPKQHNTTSRK
jgi:hypothetical protein